MSACRVRERGGGGGGRTKLQCFFSFKQSAASWRKRRKGCHLRSFPLQTGGDVKKGEIQI